MRKLKPREEKGAAQVHGTSCARLHLERNAPWESCVLTLRRAASRQTVLLSQKAATVRKGLCLDLPQWDSSQILGAGKRADGPYHGLQRGQATRHRWTAGLWHTPCVIPSSTARDSHFYSLTQRSHFTALFLHPPTPPPTSVQPHYTQTLPLGAIFSKT